MQTKHWIALGAFFAMVGLPNAARADVVKLEGGCEFRGGVDCTGSCENVSFDATCNAELSASCKGECSASADVSCSGSCSGSCKTDCEANPGTFSCRGRCDTQCTGSCEAKCSASTNGATSQADCKAKCKACCQTECSGSCEATPPSATCDSRCQASCQGQCKGQANIDCQVACQAKGTVDCQAKWKGGCSAQCTSQGGMVVCDGAVQAFKKTVDDALAWVRENVTYTADAQASCKGNECTATANAKVSCAVAPGNSANAATLIALGSMAAALVVGRRRRR